MMVCRVLKWLQAFAEERSLKWQQDKEGNMVIYKPGTNGGEHAKPVIVQVKQPLRLSLSETQPRLEMPQHSCGHPSLCVSLQGGSIWQCM